ncbi:DUF6496 domain-containing protein [Niveispirillum sp.]|uniref:DUF6496 domain-containing protein n=1 Tax=Niveispirillum sp. TaxID=1917217 RepID=UPI001B4A5610|nr:DUF6496 domain-containing protein [Niveispirillum sp.]MBP7334883.1 hypothetical protein [Niveispirillum sp.]
MTKQTGEQKEIVRDVMHDFKEGDLKSASGRKVRSRKQAVAIALHEAGTSTQESPADNRRNLRRTRQTRGSEGPTREELYEEARRKGVSGRSRMSKAELSRALGH